MNFLGGCRLIYGSFASELNNPTTPSLNGNIKSAFKAVGSCQSSIYSTLSSHFSANCGNERCYFWPRQLLKTEFREFHEHDAQYNASRAKLYTRRSDDEVGIVAAYNLGGLRLGKVAIVSV